MRFHSRGETRVSSLQDPPIRTRALPAGTSAAASWGARASPRPDPGLVCAAMVIELRARRRAHRGGEPASGFAGDGDGERVADLAHPLVAESAEPFHER